MSKQQNKNNKKFYYKKRKNHNNKINESLPFDLELLQMPIEELSLSGDIINLLKNNKFNIVADLCIRTEHDMYKVQTLNKKILLSISNALTEHGLYLKKEENGSTKLIKNLQQKEIKRSKFALDAAKDNSPIEKEKSEQLHIQNASLNEPLPSSSWRKIQKAGKWGFYDGFKIVIPCIYDEVYSFNDGLCSVELDEKCGYIDENNNIIIDLQYEIAMSFSEGFAVVGKDSKCGYINKKGEIVIPIIYDAATQFLNGEGKVKKDGRWGSIDINNNITWIK